MTLWEVCFDYFDTDRGEGETPFIPLEIFKELMGLDETDYSVFKVLSRDVIKSAIKEINTLTCHAAPSQVTPNASSRRSNSVKEYASAYYGGVRAIRNNFVNPIDCYFVTSEIDFHKKKRR